MAIVPLPDQLGIVVNWRRLHHLHRSLSPYSVQLKKLTTNKHMETVNEKELIKRVRFDAVVLGSNLG